MNGKTMNWKTDLNAEDIRDTRQAFLLIAAGGTGRDALGTFERFGGNRVAKLALLIDTEPAETAAADAEVFLSIGHDEFDAIRADPKVFGPVTTTVVREMPEFIQAESLRDGSRTIRILSQMAVEVHKKQLKRSLKKAIRDLVKTSAANRIVPVLFGSTGGGAGSALVVILGALLNKPAFKSAITEGFATDLLQRPVALLADPHCFALRHGDRHASRILSNSFVTRVEVGELAKRGCWQYCFVQGLANGEAVLDTKEEVCRNLGASVYQLCRNFSYLKSRLVDTVDSDRWSARYLGFDIPEYHIPESEHPVYASKRKPRRVRNFVSLVDGNANQGATK